MYNIILASKSPRRQSLFSLITDRYTVVPADVREDVFSAISAEQQALELGKLKCLYVARRYPESVVVGCDTLVELRGEVFGKPADNRDAARILSILSGSTHNVYTGVYIHFPDEETGFFCKTEVTFRNMTAGEIDEYISTGDSLDKAGAYGIQGTAARYISCIKGDYFNVLGLPVSMIYASLRKKGIV